MARTAFGGFEGGSLIADGYISAIASTAVGSVSLDNTIVRTGIGSLKATPASGANGYWDVGNAIVSTEFLRVYIRVTSLPGTARMLLGTASAQMNLRLNTNGTLEVRDSTTVTGTSSTALTDTSRWYRIEVGGAANAAGGLWIDGIHEVNFGGTARSVRPIFGAFDTVADTYTAYFDDWCIDSAALPGEGQCVFLQPSADNTVGSGWQKPGGGTSGLNTSVNNAPPVGIADTTSAANAETQIRNASTSTSYIATIPNYSSLVESNSVINGLYGQAWVGAPVSTGAKTGSLQITSNPAQGAAQVFQNNTGQYWTGAAAGTWPTNWKRVRTVVDTNPTIDLGSVSNLTLNITGGTVTRIAMCCEMGVYVEYTPGPPLPYSSPYPPILAQ